jgi:predicted Zn-dependent protease
VYLRVAELYVGQGRSMEALAVGFRALQIDPSRFVAVTVGWAACIGPAALPLLRRAIELHLQADRTQDATGLMQMMVVLTPRCSATRRQLAELLLRAGRTVDAIAQLRVTASILERDGNNREYLAVVDRILAIDGRNLEALRGLAHAHLRLGDPERALTALTNLMRLCEDDPVGLELLARCLAVLGRGWNAVSLLGRLSTRLRRESAFERADTLLARARRWAPHDAGFQAGLETLRQALIRPAGFEGDVPPALETPRLPPVGFASTRDRDVVLLQALDFPVRDSARGVMPTRRAR